MFKVNLVILLLMLISGCSAQYNTLKQPDGGYVMYTLSEQDIVQIVREEVMSLDDSSLINEIGGPLYGFEINTRVLIDHYTAIIKVVPVNGEISQNTTLRGFFVELKGSGTYPSQVAVVAYDNIHRKLEKTNTGIKILSYEKIKYVKKESKDSIISKLLKLKLLHEEGIINDEEYTKKKTNLIEKL